MRQGDCDSLCGIYSVVNAITWIDPDGLRKRRDNFDVAVAFIASKASLKDVTVDGMSAKRWRGLARHVISKHNAASDVEVELRNVTMKAAISDCELLDDLSKLTARGWPILAMFEGAINHFTVITGVTPSRIILFDSEGRKWFLRRSCQIGTVELSKRYWVKQKNLLVIKPISMLAEAIV